MLIEQIIEWKSLSRLSLFTAKISQQATFFFLTSPYLGQTTYKI